MVAEVNGNEERVVELIGKIYCYRITCTERYQTNDIQYGWIFIQQNQTDDVVSFLTAVQEPSRKY